MRKYNSPVPEPMSLEELASSREAFENMIEQMGLSNIVFAFLSGLENNISNRELLRRCDHFIKMHSLPPNAFPILYVKGKKHC
jgi:hypothetical protein